MNTNPAADMVRLYVTPLLPFLSDTATEDVAIQKPCDTWVFRAGAWSRHDVPELDLDTLEDLAIVAGSQRQQEVGFDSPILDTELPDGERLHVSMFPTVPLGTISLTARKRETCVAPISSISKRYKTQGWNDFQKQRVAPTSGKLLSLYRSGDNLGFLRACVRERQNMLIVGPTNSGKTTLLETLASEIDPAKRIITVEDAVEITITQPNHVRLLFHRDDRDARVSPTELLQGVMRMHPDVVVLGEMRGPEAWTYVNDVTPPHPGSICTTHGHSAESGFMRVFGLCRAAPGASSMDDRTLARMVASSIDVVVPLQHHASDFSFGPVWFIGDALERGETALELLLLE